MSSGDRTKTSASRPAVTDRGKVVSLLDHLPTFSREGREHLAGALAYRGASSWPGASATPPGTILEAIVELFRLRTDIPLELPLIAALSLVSGWLNSRRVKIDIGIGQESPKLWTLALAGSGSGKSFTVAIVQKFLADREGAPAVPMLENASSAAAFVDNVEQTPRGLWIRDEFGQFLSQINKIQHMEEIKDVLLRAYSGEPIERGTRAKRVRVDDHAISILGITVQDTFEQQIGADSLVDGFAQRFNYIIAASDPTRPITDFPIYFENMDAPEAVDLVARIREGWLRILDREDMSDARLTIDNEARALFKATFRNLFGKARLPRSFYRRTLFSMFSYAAVYHVLTERPGTVIGRESMAHAAHMIGIHLEHGQKLLRGYGLGELEKVVRKAERIRDRLARTGADLQARDLVAGIREIRTAAMARDVMGLMAPLPGPQAVGQA